MIPLLTGTTNLTFSLSVIIRSVVFLFLVLCLAGMALVSAMLFSFAASPPTGVSAHSSAGAAKSVSHPIYPIPAPVKGGVKQLGGKCR